MFEKFVSKFRFGCKPNLSGLGLRRLLFLKLTLMWLKFAQPNRLCYELRFIEFDAGINVIAPSVFLSN